MSATPTAQLPSILARGCDWSDYQPHVDVEDLARRGVGFAARKAGQGISSASGGDGFARDWEAMRSAGIPIRVAYWYVGLTQGARAQASAIRRAVGSLQRGEWIALDLERGSHGGPLDGQQVAQLVVSLLEELDDLYAPAPAIIYTGGLWRDVLDPLPLDIVRAAQCPLWTACYRLPASPEASISTLVREPHRVPRPWRNVGPSIVQWRGDGAGDLPGDEDVAVRALG